MEKNEQDSSLVNRQGLFSDRGSYLHFMHFMLEIEHAIGWKSLPLSDGTYGDKTKQPTCTEHHYGKCQIKSCLILSGRFFRFPNSCTGLLDRPIQ